MISDPHRRPPVLTAPQRPAAPPAAWPLRAPRMARARRRRRVRWVVGASVALHLAALLLFVRLAPPPNPEASPPPSDVAVVFETAKPPESTQPETPAPATAAPLPPSEAPTRQAPAAAPPPAPATPPAAPQIRAPLDQLALLPPPLPVPQPPPQSATPRLPSRPAARADGFPRPLAQNWFFPSSSGAPATVSRHAALDTRPPSNQSGDIEGAQELGPDWGSELKAYVQAHARYPEQAAQNGEQGDSMVQVTVDSDGHVKSVALEQRSGSVWLDTELLSIFRHARLPPFPAGTSQPEITFHFTLHYILRS